MFLGGGGGGENPNYFRNIPEVFFSSCCLNSNSNSNSNSGIVSSLYARNTIKSGPPPPRADNHSIQGLVGLDCRFETGQVCGCGGGAKLTEEFRNEIASLVLYVTSIGRQIDRW